MIRTAAFTLWTGADAFAGSFDRSRMDFWTLAVHLARQPAIQRCRTDVAGYSTKCSVRLSNTSSTRFKSWPRFTMSPVVAMTL